MNAKILYVCVQYFMCDGISYCVWSSDTGEINVYL